MPTVEQRLENMERIMLRLEAEVKEPKQKPLSEKRRQMRNYILSGNKKNKK